MVDDGEEFRERLRLMREHIAGEEIDEIVKWQMTGILAKKSPVAKGAPQPKCHRCWRDWHGLPQDECPGSFDTPETDI